MADELEKRRTEEGEFSNLTPAVMPEGGAVTAQAPCPMCDEMISVNARKCRHCGETLDVALRKAEEALRHTERQQPNVYMNAGGGAAAAGSGQQLRHFKHFMHIIVSVFTLGLWVPVWLLMYLFRNRSVYH